MAKMKYFNGTIELAVFPLDNDAFTAIGGVKSKHNRYDSFRRMAGRPLDDHGAIMPVTRMIEYKSNPSLHKCGARCRSATGHVCECECGGANHGAG